MTTTSTLGTSTNKALPATPRGIPANRRPGRRTGSLTSKAVVNGVLAIGTIYALAPLTWLLIAVTKNQRDLLATDGFSFADFHLWENLSELFAAQDGIFLRWLVNTLFYAGGGALVGALISVMAGYAFDKFDFPLKEKLYGVILLGVLVPSTVTALPLYLMASKIGLVNNYWGVFLPSLVSPFGVYLARIFSAGYVPGEMLEAARMDGAGEIRAFVQVALPVLRPAIATLFLFNFTAIWNNFYLPFLMLSDHRLFPVSLGLYGWNKMSEQFAEMLPLVITGAFVAIVPLIMVFVAMQRFWKSGLTAGAVK